MPGNPLLAALGGFLNRSTNPQPQEVPQEMMRVHAGGGVADGYRSVPTGRSDISGYNLPQVPAVVGGRVMPSAIKAQRPQPLAAAAGLAQSAQQPLARMVRNPAPQEAPIVAPDVSGYNLPEAPQAPVQQPVQQPAVPQGPATRTVNLGATLGAQRAQMANINMNDTPVPAIGGSLKPPAPAPVAPNPWTSTPSARVQPKTPGAIPFGKNMTTAVKPVAGAKPAAAPAIKSPWGTGAATEWNMNNVGNYKK